MRSVLEGLSGRHTAPDEKLTCLNALIELSQVAWDISAYVPASDFVRAVRGSLSSRVGVLRVAALRVLTAFNRSRTVAREQAQGSVGLFVARSLERQSDGPERGEALLWVRRFVEVCPSEVPRAVVAAIVSIVTEARDVLFATKCMETLCEVAIVCPRAVWACGGVEAIIDGVSNPAYHFLPGTLAAAFLFLVEDDTTRKYVDLQSELRSLLAPFYEYSTVVSSMRPADPPPPPPAQEGAGAAAPAKEREAAAASAAKRRWDAYITARELHRKKCACCIEFLRQLLCSWTGVVALSSYGAFCPMMSALTYSDAPLQTMILDFLYDVFNIPYTQTPTKPAGASSTTTTTPGSPGSLSASTSSISTTSTTTTTGAGGTVSLASLASGAPGGGGGLSSSAPALEGGGGVRRGSSGGGVSSSRDQGVTVVSAAGGTWSADRPLPAAVDHDVMDNHLVIVLMGLLNAGLVEALSRVVVAREEGSEVVRVRAFHLLGEVLMLANKLLHPGQCEELQDLGELMTTAMRFGDDYVGQQRASASVFQLYKYAKARAADRPLLESLNSTKEVRLRIDWAIPAATLAERVQETLVTGSKDWERWSWSRVVDLLAGPLSNPLNVDAVLAATPVFFKRLIHFYRPREKAGFARIGRSADIAIYARAGCALIDALVSTASGRKLIEDEKFLNQIEDSLLAEISYERKKSAKAGGAAAAAAAGAGAAGSQQGGSGSQQQSLSLSLSSSSSGSLSGSSPSLPPIPPSPFILSNALSASDSGLGSPLEGQGPAVGAEKEREKEKEKEKEKEREGRVFSEDAGALGEYVSLVGRLTGTAAGVQLLQAHNIPGSFFRLLVCSRRQDLGYALMKGFDYELPEVREIFCALTRADIVTRNNAVRHLRARMRLGADEIEAWGAWAIPLLVERLMDEDRRVAAEALSILHEASKASPACLDIIVDNFMDKSGAISKEKRATLLRFDTGPLLFLRFFSRQKSFRALAADGTLEQELQAWLDHGNADYLRRIEAEHSALADARTYRRRAAMGKPTGIPLTSHLFSELAKHPDGIAELERGGFVTLFASRAMNPATSAFDQRCAILVLGFIGGASPLGLHLLEKYGVPRVIATFAETSPSLSLRAISFVAMGLLAFHAEGRRALGALGWVSPLDGSLARPTLCLAVPLAYSRCPFFAIPPLAPTQDDIAFQQRAAAAVAEALAEGDNINNNANNNNNEGESEIIRSKVKITNNSEREIFKRFTMLLNKMTAAGAAEELLYLHRENPKALHAPRLVHHVLLLLEAYRIPQCIRNFMYGLTLDSLPNNAATISGLSDYLDEFKDSMQKLSSPQLTIPPPQSPRKLIAKGMHHRSASARQFIPVTSVNTVYVPPPPLPPDSKK